MKRIDRRWKVFLFEICPHSWGLGLSLFWVEDEKLLEISFFPFHLALILDRKKQAKLRRIRR